MPWWITGRDPAWGEFERLRREMDSLLGAFPGRLPSSPLWSESKLFPLLNVREQADAYVVTAEIPGMKSEDLEIKIDGDTLTLRGERKPHKLGSNESYHRRERATGVFQRSLTLPGNVDSENVKASYKSGVLRVTLNKRKVPKAAQITVETE